MHRYMFWSVGLNRLKKTISLPGEMSKIVGGVANSADPDQMPCFVASDLCLNCLFTAVCPNT